MTPKRAPVDPPVKQAKTTKGEQTKALILATALELFRERGYDATTMRAIADAAGLSASNAYYYYKSKESLIQGFYGAVHEKHRVLCEKALEGEKDLRKRLRISLETKIEASDPYHAFSGVLFRTAGDPRSPLNPFHEESRPAREASIELYRRVVEGSNARIPRALKAELPELIWVYSAGIVLFWVHDQSEGYKRTYALIERSTDLIVRLIKMASLPFMAPIRRKTVKMIREALHGELEA